MHCICTLLNVWCALYIENCARVLYIVRIETKALALYQGNAWKNWSFYQPSVATTNSSPPVATYVGLTANHAKRGIVPIKPHILITKSSVTSPNWAVVYGIWRKAIQISISSGKYYHMPNPTPRTVVNVVYVHGEKYFIFCKWRH